MNCQQGARNTARLGASTLQRGDGINLHSRGRIADLVGPAVIVGGRRPHAEFAQEPSQGTVAGADFKAGALRDQAAQVEYKRLGIETINSLALHERHEQASLSQQGPQQAKPEK